MISQSWQSRNQRNHSSDENRKKDEMADSTALFDIMRTTRAMRRLKPAPVPDELIRRILEAGSYAANGGANQRWRFLVIKDRSIKEQVQVWYKRAYDEVVGPRYANSDPPPGSSPGRYRRQHDAVEYLTNHYHEAPVWIVACMEGGDGLPDRALGASIYPAVQNMLLAARVFGVGGTIATLHPVVEERVHALFGIPDGAQVVYCMPLGYPRGEFGSVQRLPLTEVCGVDGWGNGYPG
jgi:nitroreductase